MTPAEVAPVLGSWPIIATLCGVSFGLGALWQHKRTCAKYDRHVLQLSAEIREELSQLAGDSRGTAARKFSVERLNQRSEHPARRVEDISARGARTS